MEVCPLRGVDAEAMGRQPCLLRHRTSRVSQCLCVSVCVFVCEPDAVSMAMLGIGRPLWSCRSREMLHLTVRFARIYEALGVSKTGVWPGNWSLGTPFTKRHRSR